MQGEEESPIAEEGYLGLMTLQERKDLVDSFMEKRGLKPKVDVNRAWDNVVEIKRDQGS